MQVLGAESDPKVGAQNGAGSPGKFYSTGVSGALYVPEYSH